MTISIASWQDALREAELLLYLEKDPYSIASWNSFNKESLQNIRDILLKEKDMDYVLERGRWSLVRMDYWVNYAWDQHIES